MKNNSVKGKVCCERAKKNPQTLVVRLVAGSSGGCIWGGLQDVFRNPTDDFKNDVLSFNTFLKSCDTDTNNKKAGFDPSLSVNNNLWVG